MWTTILHSSAAHGAVTGWLSAAAVDFHAFLAWKKLDDFITYDWSTALFRWGQGIVVGAVTGAGYGALVS